MGEMVEIRHQTSFDDEVDAWMLFNPLNDGYDDYDEDDDEEYVFDDEDFDDYDEDDEDEEEDIPKEEIVADYMNAVYKYMPNLIDYLDLNNKYGFYMEQIRGINNIDEPPKYDYMHLDFLSVLELCLKILDSLNPSLKDFLIEKINDGTIVMGSQPQSKSRVGTINGVPIITIGRFYNIFDVGNIIHELFHMIHLNHFQNDLSNDVWYATTEAIAMTGEIYAYMYMYKNNLVQDDSKAALREYFWQIFIEADITFCNGIILDIYDKAQKINSKLVATYNAAKGIISAYDDVFDSKNIAKELLYHEKSTYTMGFPIALFLALKMLDDDYYIKLFFKQLSMIECHTPKSFLAPFGLDGMMDDEDFIIQAFTYINDLMDKLYNKDEVNLTPYKPYMIEMV